MNHPSCEQWMAYLYGETTPAARADAEAHLYVCPECKRQVEGWRGTMASLDQWRLPKRTRAVARPSLVKWAIAATVFLGVGLGLGRLGLSSEREVQKIRAELLPALRAELKQQMAQEVESSWQNHQAKFSAAMLDQMHREVASATNGTLVAANAETRRQLQDLDQTWSVSRVADRQEMLGLYNRLDRQRLADRAWLRRDLETVAVLTERRLQNTQFEIGQLADASSPGANPITPVNHQP